MSAAEMSAETVRRFMLAGRARVTLVSEATGARYTYRVGAKDSVWFVSVLTGADNEADYTFLGTIFADDSFRHGRRARIGADAPSARAFAWAWPHLAAGRIPPALKVYHEGRCGRCALPLTDPVSIESGFGPTCRGL
ncbi:hypothetical protein DOMOVOI_00170 [Brevundimonas phage vB_BpoS-Domovoi]|uniref:Uncharacterized protein n=1 Tax=Brevundimonas phage vB_BpoS-Domovoi TaxID=2948598 RepID=A0A9E7MQZ3_9CAUD|nr:hypothetical protein DOMOVOI_00170 [Brevundimonas phage vB_BpoS-Domovoi]